MWHCKEMMGIAAVRGGCLRTAESKKKSLIQTADYLKILKRGEKHEAESEKKDRTGFCIAKRG